MSFLDLNDSILSQVRHSADIVEIISQVTPLKIAGKSHKGLCPFHREKTPSFTVDRGKGLFYCFGCGAGGDVFKFLMLAERYTFPEAVEHVAGRVGIQIPRRKGRGDEKERDDVLEVLEDAAEAFHQALGWKPNEAERYLTGRDVAPEIWNKYGFGYAPDSWDYLLTRLGRKHSIEKLSGAGLVLPRKSGDGNYDRFRNRLMIPIHSEGGSLIGFGGRTLDGSDPKYLNSPESSVFNKSRLLYNLHRAKDSMRKLERAILVEGYFDCITLNAAGIPGVVASMGTSLTSGQAALLARFARRVVIGYDGDNAGRNATLRAAPILLSAGLAVQVLDVGAGHDPDTLLRREGMEKFMLKLGHARDIFEFALEQWVPSVATMGTREKQEALEAFVPLLSAVTGVARNDAAQKVGDGLRLQFDVVWSRIRGRATDASRERTINEPISTGQKQLLRAALTGELPDSLRVRLNEDYFDDPACKAIYSVIKTKLQAGAPLDFSAIATDLKGDEELRRLSELSLEDQDEQFSPEKLEQILRLMEQNHLENRRKEIQIQIQEAEREGDHERLDQLYVEKTRLLRLPLK